MTTKITKHVTGDNVLSRERNLLVNGDMVIWSGASGYANTSVSSNTITDGAVGDSIVFGADKWGFFNHDAAFAGTWDLSRSTDVPSGKGFGFSYKFDVNTADASIAPNDVCYFLQGIKGKHIQHIFKGTSDAKSLTLSFHVKSNKTGTYVVRFYDTHLDRHIGRTYTIDSADTWEKKILIIPGDTGGTATAYDNTERFHVQFWLAAGEGYTLGTLPSSWEGYVKANVCAGQTNLADNASNYLNLTGVQLELGEGATEFEFKSTKTTARASDNITLDANPFFVSTNTIASDFTIPEGYNAMTPGPVSVANTATVTVSNNSVWTVV